MFESQPSFWIKIEMNSTVIIGYGWHHISVTSLHEAVELYWHRLNTLNGVTWNICRGVHFAVQNQCQTVLVNQYRQKENLHLWYWYRLNFFHYFPHLTSVFSVLDGRVVFANFRPQRFVRVSFKQSEISRFFLPLIPQGLGASEKKILYNTTRGRTHLLPFF